MDTQMPELQAVVKRLKKVEGQCGALARQNRWLKGRGCHGRGTYPEHGLQLGGQLT